MAYHNRVIFKGKYGEFSKIEEEMDELKNAIEQKNKILTICELSDLIGAIEEFALKQGVTLQDLKEFSDLTKSAFKEGKR
jgi:phosphoribosyl-ATP pyrophosphohydrolase